MIVNDKNNQKENYSLNIINSYFNECLDINFDVKMKSKLEKSIYIYKFLLYSFQKKEWCLFNFLIWVNKGI